MVGCLCRGVLFFNQKKEYENEEGVFGVVFFQAEDSIRGLVRSREIGNVYKKQVVARNEINLKIAEGIEQVNAAVSYTHVTLPMKRTV